MRLRQRHRSCSPKGSASCNGGGGRLGLRNNGHKCEGLLAKIICEAEEFFEDLIEVIEGRPDGDHRGRRPAPYRPPRPAAAT